MKKFLSAFLLFGAVFMFQTAGASAAETCTWDGGDTVNDNFSDTDNWDAACGGVPDDTDLLVFNNTGATANIAAVNDISSLTIDDLSFTGNTTYSFTISGTQSITVSGGNISNTSTGAATISAPIVVGAATNFNSTQEDLVISGIVSGTAAIDKTGADTLVLSGTNTFTGAVTVSAGELKVTNVSGLGTTAGATSVSADASLTIAQTSNGTVLDETITLAGDGVTGGYTLKIVDNGDYTGDFTISSDITLSDATVKIASDFPVVLSGVLSGTGGFTYDDVSTEQTGSLTLTGTNTYTGTTSVNDIFVANGTIGPVTVASGGTLKGIGTVGVLTVSAGGTVAPGESPGCLSSGNTVISGNFDVEIGGTTACTGYDQLQVTGTVNVTGATLNTSLFDDFVPEVDNTFTIILNDAADAVTGTFAGLAEGATFEVGRVTFSISYVGGDGNDVVLTVEEVTAVAGSKSAPKAPNTGYQLLTSNPLLTLSITTLLAGSIAEIARRLKESKSKI